MSRVWYSYDADTPTTTIVYRGDRPPAEPGTEGDAKGEPGPDAGGGEVVASYAYPVDAPPPFRFEHDPGARVFRLTAPDGTVEVFRDNPTRFLCVEPDPQTGAIGPVWKHGRPVFLYLCREEREMR